jgi:tetratricopeptide (TPR) repeat protein
MAVDPVTGAVVGWLVGQLGTAGRTRLGRLIGGDKQQKALRALVRDAIRSAVEEAGGADGDVLREALLAESPDTDHDKVVDVVDVVGVVDLRTALGRLIRPKLAALAEQGYAFDADRLTDALFRQVTTGVQADAARDGPLAALAEFLRHERLAATGEQAVVELREIRSDLRRLQLGPLEAERFGGLPGEVDHFTGRREALETLISRVDSQDPASPVVATHVFDGMPGVGKTAFVIHAAHVLADRYPDGAMFVDLLGYTDHKPLSTSQALTELLAQAGLPRTEIPGDSGPQRALWQRLMRPRRSLVVLDNALDADQVTPLLPEAPGCLTLITSRSKLYEINATPLHLQVLTADDARNLFVAVAGPDRCRDPAEVDRIVAACDRLPLAIRLLAGRIRHGDPIEEIADDVEQLPVERRIQGVFQLSYESLDAELRRAFGLLGVHPGGGVTAGALAALADVEPIDCRRMLRGLVNNNLIERVRNSAGESASSRYRMHDLLWAHARSVAAEEIPPDARQAAIDRLISHYAVMVDVVARLHHGESAPSPATGDLAFHDAAQAREWLTAERENILACIDATPSLPADLPVTLGWLLQELCYWPEAARCHDRVRMICRRAGDRAGEADALRGLADVDQMLDRYEEAGERYEQARALFHRLDDPVGEAYAMRGLADVDQMLGKYDRAHERYQQARTIARQISDLSGEAYTLRGLADVDQMRGEYQRAGEQYEQALSICQDIGDRTGEASALRGLATEDQMLDRYEQAAERYRQVLGICRAIGDRTGVGYALRGLADVDQMLDRYEQAMKQYEQARTIFHNIGNRTGEASALRGLGDINQLLDRYEQAESQYERARAICREIDDPAGEAGALLGQAAVDRLRGRDGQAYERYELAYAFFRRMGNQTGEAYTLRGLADIDQNFDRYEQAANRYELSLIICHDIGDRYGAASALRGLADVDQMLGLYGQAANRYEISRSICHDIGDRYGAAESVQGMAEVDRRLGQYARSRERYERALEIRRGIGDQDGEAQALWGLGGLATVNGQPAAARSQWLSALQICEAIGSPFARKVREALAGPDR